MTLVSIVLMLVVVGLVMWLINTYIPMAAGIKSVLNIVVLIVVTIWRARVWDHRKHTRSTDSRSAMILPEEPTMRH